MVKRRRDQPLLQINVIDKNVDIPCMSNVSVCQHECDAIEQLVRKF